MIHLKLFSCDFTRVVLIGKDNRFNNVSVIISYVEIYEINNSNLWHLIVGNAGLELVSPMRPP